jgi:isopenicillin-N epimerase
MYNNLAKQFLLKPEITFLNFGSFGACPKPIFDDYQNWQMMLEQEPVQFITVQGPIYLQQAREALGSYLNCRANDLVYVTNPSYAVNIIAKSFALKTGDEVLTTDLEYGACDKTWNYYCNKVGAMYKRQAINFPLSTKENFVDQFFEGVTSNTKLIFISHITSTTALRLPVELICKRAKELGILTFIDGAHAPAQVPIDLQSLEADIYTGACHKWMMTPKGSSFLYIKKELQNLFPPLVFSWGWESAMPSDSEFIDWHQLQGTRDFSAFLTVPKAIEFMKENDWPLMQKYCQRLVLQNATRFCELVNTKSLCPVSEEFLVQMFSIPINCKDPIVLKNLLYSKYKMEIPVMPHNDKVYLRFSIQAFNTQQDLDLLYAALQDIIATTTLISLR